MNNTTIKPAQSHSATYNLAHNLGILIVLFLCLSAIIPTLLLIAKVSVSAYHLYLVLGVTFIVSFFYARSLANAQKYIWLGWVWGVFAVVFGVVVVASGLVHDFSFDGNMYHQPAVIFFAGGWNPIYDAMPMDLQKNSSNFAIVHYPKATWISGSLFACAFGYVEYAKSVLWLAIIASLLYSYSVLKVLFVKITKVELVISALLITFAPVIMSGMFNTEVDSINYLFILLFICSIVLFITNSGAILYSGLIILSGSFLMNIKFTSLVYVSFFLLIFFVYVWFSNRGKAIQSFLIGVFVGLLGVFVVGFPTYITNTFNHKHPFYPVFGHPTLSQTIIGDMMPKKFSHKSSIEKFALSLFSKSEADCMASNYQPTLKIPFSIKVKEITAFSGGNIRIAGMGVWFSGILLVSFLLCIYLLIKKYKNVYLLILFSCAIWGSCLLNPEAWWARLSPQLWLFPLVIAVFSINLPHKTPKFGGRLLLFLSLINLLILFIPYSAGHITNELMMKDQLSILKQYEGKSFNVCFNPFWSSNKDRLNHFGIKYQEVSNNCTPSVHCLQSNARICIHHLPKPMQAKLLNLDKQLYKDYLKNKLKNIFK